VPLHHLAGDLDVDGIDVVEEAGGEESADLEDEPGENEDGKGAGTPSAGGGLAISFQLLGSQFFSYVFCLFFHGAVGVEGFAGAFFE
jgi:hypothetical protein